MDQAKMDSERRLFEAALELEGEARRHFLEELAGRQPEGASRLRALLAAHERPELSPAHLDRPLEPPEAEQVGPYRLLERLGEGGMGVVYVAEQTEPVRRQVALKLIKGVTYSRESLGRFHSERQALALMNHPNIARILDAGSTDDGRPFFVMEYVQGPLLLDYCDRRQLSVDDRLDLFIQVCEAVQHAHQKGVIHRDLKPSNILVEEVDGKAIPKVIDFGVAKMLYQRFDDSTLHTRLGGFIGTPGYVSPEQAQATGLDVDTRADVYSLGAVLYELLTGLRPFEFRGAGLSTLQHVLTHRDPKTPSLRVLEDPDTAAERARSRRAEGDGLQRSLRGDLDWITLKALEKDRTRRYAAASELAADVRRYRVHETVLARPPSTAYQLSRFVRRHALLLAVGTLAVLALVIGTIGTSLGLIRARQEAERARVHAAIAEEINTFLNDDLLAAVAPGQQGIDVTMREVLDTAAQRVEERFPEQPRVEASLRRTIGRTYRSLGVLDAAEQHLERALDLYGQELGPADPETRTLLFELGVIYRGQGRAAEAEEAFEQVRQGNLAAPSLPDLDAIDELSLAAVEEIAILRQQAGRLDEAERLYLQALAGHEALHGREHPETLQVLARLAVVYRYTERWHEAERIHREALAVNRAHYGDQHPRTLYAISRFAAFYLGWERHEQAEALLREGLAPSREVLGEEHPATLININNLGWLYLKLGRYEESEKLLLENLEVKQRTLGELHPSTLEGLQNVVILYEAMGAKARHGEYLARFAEVLERVCDSPAVRTEDRLEYAEVLLSAAVPTLRNPDRALALALQAVEATERQDELALAMAARSYAAIGSRDRAVEVAREALQLTAEGSEGRARMEELVASLGDGGRD